MVVVLGMNRRTRFWSLTFAAFFICSGVVILTAYSVGADPFHPRSRHIWALSLVAAFYASIRIAMIIGRFLDARVSQENGATAAPFGLFSKKDHAIDRRLAERRARVEAAEKNAKQSDDTTKEDGDE